MPTSAVTGTKDAKAEENKNKVSRRARREAHDSAVEAGYAAPLADHSGNGSVQVVCPDGSIKNVDASAEGWRDEVAALDPKHPSLKYG